MFELIKGRKMAALDLIFQIPPTDSILKSHTLYSSAVRCQDGSGERRGWETPEEMLCR